MKRRRHFIMCVFSVLVIFPVCARGDSVSSVPAGNDVLKLMTFNIRVDTMLDGPNGWSHRKPIVYNVLASQQADVFGLQEALSHQTAYLQSRLPEYLHYGVGRKDGELKGEACPIFFRRNRFTLLDSGTFWFSKEPSEPGSKDWGAMCPRICTWVRLEDRQTRKRLYVYNVHLDNLSQSARRHSVQLLASRIASRKASDPFVVLGDFNMDMDNSAMAYLTNHDYGTPYPRMTDAWETVHTGQSEIGTRHGFHGRTSGPKIDHIPVSDGIETLTAQIDQRHARNGRYPSDHFPVVATVRINPVYTAHVMKDSQPENWQ